jgi:hypothetical protein
MRSGTYPLTIDRSKPAPRQLDTLDDTTNDDRATEEDVSEDEVIEDELTEEPTLTSPGKPPVAMQVKITQVENFDWGMIWWKSR